MISLTISNGVVIFDEKKYPKISALLAQNDLFIENDEIVGTASDGTIVSMCKICLSGYPKDDKYVLDTVENYLNNNPTPDTW